MPWADLPYHSPVDPNPLAHPPGTPPWCRASDLTITAPRGADGASTFMFFDYVVKADPGRRCALQGYPVVRETDEAHTWSLISEPPDDFAIPPGGVLDERHPGEIEVRWGHDASGYGVDVGPAPRIVTFDLPHQGGRLVVRDVSVGWMSPNPGTAGAPHHLGRLVVEPLRAPAPAVYSTVYRPALTARPLLNRPSVRAGSVLSYDVWIAGPVAISPCFGFRERLLDWRTGKVVASEEHELNCAGLQTLPTYGRLFAMALKVPASAPAGAHYEVQWESDVGSDYSGGSVSVPVTVAGNT